ncbi:hypothetical protein BI364_03750 [Acidihalobacter yilgarnensis]|uniref:Uncharacterized protein n=1 Tax=Acidihalobacter yilgarnensis TaxID=2819280 RepID=A0A1D8IL87_9GAMM|nr:hypothetical protein [Acidihalobacter yilgarnensis]AOU97227.1 hypothetical protein BI364_03750 [Acidihalobacter yilgarnensis]
MIETAPVLDTTPAFVRSVELRLSGPAARALAARDHPLTVHLELLFSCMIRKQVSFPESTHPDARPLDCGNKAVQAWFRAVGTKTCLISDQPVPDLQTFPIKRIEPFLPRWLRLDFKAGQWRGEFGYVSR